VIAAGDVPAPPVRERRVLPVVALLAVIIVVLSGGYVVAAALSEPTGPPVSVAGVVRVAPLSGWELAGRFTDPPVARLTRGSGNLDVAAVPFEGSARELVRWYVDHLLEPEATQLSVSSATRVTLESGLAGARISYVGTFGDRNAPIEGQVSAVVSPSGVGAVFNGWSQRGLLQYVLGDVDRMVARADVA
jgi:hypothetical protein